MGSKKGYGFYFMIVGLVIGIFSISFYFSYGNSMKNNILDEIEGKAKYKIISDSKLKVVEESFKNNKNGIILEKSITLNDKVYKIIGVNKDALKEFNLEVNKDKILVGKGFEKISYSKNDKKYLSLSKEDYEIEKVVKNNGFAFSIIMNLEDFMNHYKEESLFTIGVTYINKNINKEEIVGDIKKLDLQGIGGGKLSIDEVNLKSDEKGEINFIPIIIVVVSFINVCTFSLMWITSRKREIALYKAIGANNLEIFKILIIEIIGISIISFVVALIIQQGVNYFVNANNLIGKYIFIDFITLIKCSLVILIMSFLSVLPSYITSTYYKPAEVLKEE